MFVNIIIISLSIIIFSKEKEKVSALSEFSKLRSFNTTSGLPKKVVGLAVQKKIS
jgi:hypothetical protein